MRKDVLKKQDSAAPVQVSPEALLENLQFNSRQGKEARKQVQVIPRLEIRSSGYTQFSLRNGAGSIINENQTRDFSALYPQIGSALRVISLVQNNSHYRSYYRSSSPYYSTDFSFTGLDAEYQILLIKAIAQSDSLLQIKRPAEKLALLKCWKHEIDTKLSGSWTEKGLSLAVKFIDPKTECSPPEFEHWELQDFGEPWIIGSSYMAPLSPENSELLKLFNGASNAIVPLEKVTDELIRTLNILPANNSAALKIDNRREAPSIKMTTPVAQLSIRENRLAERGGGGSKLVLDLHFNYPDPTPDTIWSRNTRFEANAEKKLSKIIEKEDYEGHSDSAFLSQGKAVSFLQNLPDSDPDNWDLTEIRELKNRITFQPATFVLELDAPLKENLVTLRLKIRLNKDLYPVSEIRKYHWERNGDRNQGIRKEKGETLKTMDFGQTSLKDVSHLAHKLSEAKSWFWPDPDEKDFSQLQTFKISWPKAMRLLKDPPEHCEVIRKGTDRIDGDWLGHFVSERISDISRPEGFRGRLRKYQLEGYNWLQLISKVNLGGILADEMGLGKTVEALAWLQWRKNERGNTPGTTLISSPTSPLEQWEQEAHRFTPGLKLAHVTQKNIHNLSKLYKENDLILISHHVLREEVQRLQKFNWSEFVVDEAQVLKNPKSQISLASRSIKARMKLALTGTPLENSLIDLWSITDFIHPGLLGELPDFKKKLKALELSSNDEAIENYIADRTSMVILRRTKAEVLPKHKPFKEQFQTVSMSEEQKKAYQELEKHLYSELIEEGSPSRSNTLRVLTRLRQFVNHPETCPDIPENLKKAGSAKMAEAIAMIDSCTENDEKLILFCQFTPLLQMLKKHIQSRKIPLQVLTGQTKKRQDKVDTFNNQEGSSIFLSNLKAGGAGLNIPAAHRVFLYDPWWNPAVELQALQRGDRPGREGALQVHRLITAGTVEERIIALAEKKRVLFDTIMSGSLREGPALSSDELLSLVRPADWEG